MTAQDDPKPADGPRRPSWLVVAAAVAVGVALVALAVRGSRSGGGTAPTPAVSLSHGPLQHSWLLIGSGGSLPLPRGAAPAWLAVLAADDAGGRVFMLDLPPSALTIVSGYGSTTLARAMVLGREPLLVSAASGLLGIAIDHTLQLTDGDLTALIDGAGGLPVSPGTPSGLSSGKAAVAYIAGRVATDELARGGRRLGVWAALLAHYHVPPGPATLGKLVSDLAQGRSDASPDQIRSFFAAAATPAPAQASVSELPVTDNVIQAGTQGYQPDATAVQALVAQHLAGSRLSGERLLGRKVEILNGTANPAAGRAAALRLTPRGFPVVRQANADRSDYAMTRIVVYSGSKAAASVAGEIRAALGVGDIVVSRQQQGVVDVTVILGGDFEPGGA